MIKTYDMVMFELAQKGYAAPKSALTALLKKKSLVQIRRGLYADDEAVSRRVVAAVLYGPSYISFHYALSAAGLIPERTPVITSAVFNKNKNKTYRTPLGEFHYYYLPNAVYPYGIGMESEDGMSYLIASPEKALCDMVYKTPKVTSLKAMTDLLFEDWRMESSDLANLDAEFIRWIAPRYRRKSVMALARFLERNHT